MTDETQNEFDSFVAQWSGAQRDEGRQNAADDDGRRGSSTEGEGHQGLEGEGQGRESVKGKAIRKITWSMRFLP